MAERRLEKAPADVELRNVNERLLISALREQELAALLQTERAQLDAILSSIGDAVLVVDRTGTPVLTNAAYTRMMGDPNVVILKDSAGQVIPPYDAPWCRAARGEAFTMEFSTMSPDGTYQWWEANGRPIGHDVGPQVGVIVIRDVSERKGLEKALHRQALHDGLTGLPNRILLYDRLDQALLSEHRTEDPLAFLLLDLDHFKEVNDMLGHYVGDLLLCEIANRLLLTLRAADTVARLGGDEFAILMPQTDRDGAVEVADRIRSILEAAITLEGNSLYIRVSIGIALSSGRGKEAQLLLRQADMAMYEAKRTQSGHVVYTAALGLGSGQMQNLN